jgi:hypothetical protein
MESAKTVIGHIKSPFFNPVLKGAILVVTLPSAKDIIVFAR